MESPFFPDIECAGDYLKALGLRGLDQRKQLSELLQFGCFKVLPWLYYVTISESYPISIDTDEVELVHKVMAILDSDLIGTMPDMTAEDICLEGWILDRDVIKMSEGELREELRRRRETA